MRETGPLKESPYSSFYHFSDGGTVTKNCNSSAFRLHCHKSIHTGCDSRSLASAEPGIPLHLQRVLHSVSVGTKRVPLAHSALAGHWRVEQLQKILPNHNFFWTNLPVYAKIVMKCGRVLSVCFAVRQIPSTGDAPSQKVFKV